jgi:cytochrome c-type biogenesis protein CcmF
MLTDIGHLALILALVACGYAVLSSLLGAWRNDDRLVQSGRTAATLVFPLVGLACIGLWYALITFDFSVKYVADVSSRATPLFYRITALWGSQGGSILFWNLLTSAFIFVAMRRNWHEDKELLPYVTAVACLVALFFILINLATANPFLRFDFPPDDGRGLNPLLRHPGMIIHPPMLYAGYTSFVIPFAFLIASLAVGRRDNLWLLKSRRWTLAGWAFLAAGLLLGGRWAHDVLGWGGYWGWDPSENMPFVSWLLATAFLHSAMIQEKRGMFKNWNVLLMALTFVSIFFGTSFIRSGLLTSVHAFAKSNLGPLFLGFMVFILGGTILLWLHRLETLHSENKLDSWFSREGIFLLQNVLFVSSAVTIFLGTIFPTITEAVSGVRITVSPPFYNQVAGPQLILLVLVMGVAPLLAWRKASVRALGRMSLIPAALSSISFALIVLGSGQVIPALLLVLCLYTFIQTGLEYLRGVRARVHSTGEGIPAALLHLVQRNQRRYGGYLIHIGIVLIAVGAIGKGFYGTDVIRNVRLNDSFTVGSYTFTYRGIQPAPCEFNDCQSTEAAVLVTSGRAGAASIVGAVYPHRDQFPAQQETSTIADITGSFNEEVYVILAGWERDGMTASFQVYINPLINWIWLGGIVLILGFLVAFWRMEPAAAVRTVPFGRTVGAPSK